jgi:hypothetical protein
LAGRALRDTIQKNTKAFGLECKAIRECEEMIKKCCCNDPILPTEELHKVTV